MSRPARILAWILGTLAALVVVVVGAAWLTLRASLPRIEGEARLAGLGAPVAIERDAAGVPVIRGATRADVARATGFRARPGSAVPDGPAAPHRRRRARGPAGRGPARRRPRDPPAPVPRARARGAGGARCRRTRAARGLRRRRECGRCIAARAALRVLAARPVARRRGAPRTRCSSSTRCGSTCRDSPMPTSSSAADWHRRCPTPPIACWSSPTPRARRRSTAVACRRCRCRRRKSSTCARSTARSSRRLDATVALDRDSPKRREQQLGGGRQPRRGRRRAGRERHAPGPSRAEHLVSRAPRRRRRRHRRQRRDACPGVPAIVAGSNGRVAWGFTNSYGDFQDLVRLEPGPAAGNLPHRRRPARIRGRRGNARGRGWRAGGARRCGARSGVR